MSCIGACNAKTNTDKEIWRERPGDYYADSIHVTQSNSIGINCGGYVNVMPIRDWFKAGMIYRQIQVSFWNRFKLLFSKNL